MHCGPRGGAETLVLGPQTNPRYLTKIQHNKPEMVLQYGSYSNCGIRLRVRRTTLFIDEQSWLLHCCGLLRKRRGAETSTTVSKAPTIELPPQSQGLPRTGEVSSCLLDVIRSGKSQSLPTGRRIRLKERLLCQCCHSRSVSRLSSFIIPTCIMDSDSVIPERRCSWSPPKANLSIDVVLINIEEIVEDNIAFSLVEPNNAVSECTVNPQ